MEDLWPGVLGINLFETVMLVLGNLSYRDDIIFSFLQYLALQSVEPSQKQASGPLRVSTSAIS